MIAAPKRFSRTFRTTWPAQRNALDDVMRWDHGPTALPHMVLASLAGMVVGFLTLDLGFITGTGPYWQQPHGDPVGYLASALYYVDDSWRLPLFDLPMLNYPEGGSVVYSDGLPIAALLVKILRSSTGVAFNYFGPWKLLGYVAMAVVVARFGWEAGNRSIMGTLAVSLLALSSTAFNARVDHIALSSQFLIVWALLSYLRGASGTLRAWECPVLVGLAVLIHPYLCALVLAILSALADIAWRIPSRRRTIVISGIATLAVLGIALPLAGYLSVQQPASVAAQGFGFYSWNLVTLVVPGHDSWFWHAPQIVRDATGGQYEGESYLGGGALALLAVCLIIDVRRGISLVSRHRGLAMVLIICALFAASNRIFAGSILIAEFEVPRVVSTAASVFRSNGRFIWPMLYALTLAPALLLRKTLRYPIWLTIVIGAALLQTIEASPVRAAVRARTSTGQEDAIDRPLVAAWIAAHERVWQYPSYFCGGLRGGVGNVGFVWEGQLEFEAARLRRPNNSVMMGRPLKDCGRENQEAMAMQLESGTLYVLSLDSPSKSPRIADIVRSPACKRLSWSYVCSANWVQPSASP